MLLHPALAPWLTVAMSVSVAECLLDDAERLDGKVDHDGRRKGLTGEE